MSGRGAGARDVFEGRRAAAARAARRMMETSGQGGSGAALELWGGVGVTVNRVGDRYHDQVERTGHADRAGDLRRIAALGIRRLRYPVLWERVAPLSPLRPLTGDRPTSAWRASLARHSACCRTRPPRHRAGLLDAPRPRLSPSGSPPTPDRLRSGTRGLTRHADQRTAHHRSLLRALRPLVSACEMRLDIRQGSAAAVSSHRPGDACGAGGEPLRAARSDR